jgi:hypothetical protein
MSNGGVVGVTNPPSKTAASGIWNLEEVRQAQARSQWPDVSAGNLINDSSLKIYYDFNNTSCYPGSGTGVTNLISGGPGGTLTNGPAFATDSTGGHLTFDGTNDHVLIGTTTPLQMTSGTFTKSWWVWITNGGSGGFSTLDGWTGAGSHVTYIFSEQLFSARASFVNDGGGASIATQRGKWVQITVTNQIGSNMRYYINGSFISQTTFTTNYSYSSSYQLGGITNDNFWLQGKMAVYLFYNRGLTDQEILDNHNALKARFGL